MAGNYFYAAFRRPGHPEANLCHRPGLSGGVAGQQPPNLTPLFNKIGTIAGTRVSPKRLVTFGNNLRHVVAGAKGY